jgi:hypothetical protein
LSWIAHVQEADTLSAMAERLTDVLPWRVAVLYRAHNREGLLRPIWSKGCASVTPDDLAFALQPPDSLVAHCCVTRTPIVVISEAEHVSWPLHQTARRLHADLGLRVAGAVPLLHADAPVGALFVGGDEAGIGHQDLRFRNGRPGKADTTIDREPAFPAAIEIEIHTDLAGAAERHEGEIVV